MTRRIPLLPGALDAIFFGYTSDRDFHRRRASDAWHSKRNRRTEIVSPMPRRKISSKLDE